MARCYRFYGNPGCGGPQSPYIHQFLNMVNIQWIPCTHGAGRRWWLGSPNWWWRGPYLYETCTILIVTSNPFRLQAAPQTVEANGDSQRLSEVFCCVAVVVMWGSLVFWCILFPCTEGGTIRLLSPRCISWRGFICYSLRLIQDMIYNHVLIFFGVMMKKHISATSSVLAGGYTWESSWTGRAACFSWSRWGP